MTGGSTLATAAPARLPELGVIGWPLERTYSPVMQQAALAGAGLRWTYSAIPVRAEETVDFARRAASEMRGVNVTTPHKGAMARLCTELDELSAAAGAVNTVVFGPGGAMCGRNTDGPGLLAALVGTAGFMPPGASVVVAGAGGSARAAAAALAQAGAAQITIVNRTRGHAVSTCAGLGRVFPGTRWSAEGLPGSSTAGGAAVGGASPARDAASAQCIAQADLILSCVPPAAAGAVLVMLDMAPRSAVFMDLNYGPGPTALHLAARRAGLRAVPGLEMLLWQGVLAFEHFTGIADLAPALRQMRGALAGVAGEWWEC